MIKRLALMVLFYGIALGFAQEPGPDVTLLPITPPPQPLPAPHLPTSGTGWLDLTFKMLPYAWGILSPFLVAMIGTYTPKLMKKIPAVLLPVVSGVIGTVGGALTGVIDQTVLDAGGVQPDMGALQGGGTGVAATMLMQKEPMPTADDKGKKAA